MIVVQIVALTVPYGQYPLERALEGVARAGYTRVGFGWMHQKVDVLGLDPQGDGVKECRRLCDTYGLVPTVIGRGSSNERISLGELLKRRVNVAKELGVTLIQSAGASRYRRFPQEPYPASEYWAAHRRYVQEMKEAGDYARDAGVTVSIKPHTGTTATAAHQRQILSQIKSEGVKACYDPGNILYYEGVAPEQGFDLIADETVEIVAKDHAGERAESNFPIPGDGDVDWVSIFKTAKDHGFDGVVAIERVDGDREADSIDERMARARERVVELLVQAGLDVE